MSQKENLVPKPEKQLDQVKKSPRELSPELKKLKEDQDAYAQFIKENKGPWLTFNICMTLGSIGLAVLTYFILQWQPNNCDSSNLRLPLWMVFGMHIVNAVETLMNLTGLEAKVCTNPILCGFFIFELVILVYMQISYFES